MRLLAFFSILCSIVGTVLSVLLIVAGNRPSFLEDMDILTLNTTNVGKTLATSPDSPVYSALNNPTVTSLLATNPTASALAGELGSVVQSVAESIGLNEFYSLHLLDYCEGDYSPSPIATDATKNVSACSNSTSLWTFNLTSVLQSQLKTGISLSEIQFPEEVQEGFQALETAMRVMFAFYCAAAGISGIAILTGLLALGFNGRGSACLNVIWGLLDVAVMIVASVIATIVMNVAAGTVNNYTDQFGVVAYKGDKFLAITWASSAVLVLGWLVWCIDCCVGGSKRRQRYQQAPRKDWY